MGLLGILGDVAGIAANPVTGLAKVALDVAPEIASWFGDDDATAAVTKIADTVKAITGTDDPEQARTALADPALVFQLRQQTAQFAHEERLAQLKSDQEAAKALLEDIASARARDVERTKSGSGNPRANIMLISAMVGLVIICALAVLGRLDGNSSAAAFVLMVGTQLLGHIGSVFNFEFGSSAGSLAKTNLLAQAPPIVPKR